MSRAKSHHLVPRRYLQRFAKDGQVMVVRFGGRCGPESIRRAATASEFYTTRGPLGEPDDHVELWLSRIESMLYPAFEAVDSGRWPLGPTAREQMALWVAVQYLRTWMVRDIGAAVSNAVVDDALSPSARASFVENQVKKHPDVAAEIVRSLAEANLHASERLLRERASSAEWHAEGIDKYASRLAQGLLGRRWALVRFERRALATGDEPVGLAPRGPGPVGIGNAHGVTFPLDRRTGLMMMAEDGADEVLTATSSVARTINRLTVASTRLAVFYHPDDRPIDGLSIPTAPRTVRSANIPLTGRPIALEASATAVPDL